MMPRNLVRNAPIRIEPETRDWTTNAACNGYPPELWFPADSDTETQAEAVRICRTCPVRRDCLIDAMTAETGRQASTRWGIWGGYTPVERVMLERMQGQGGRRAGGIVRNWIADLDRLTAEELAKGAGNGEN